jgi:hypothetical protein
LRENPAINDCMKAIVNIYEKYYKELEFIPNGQILQKVMKILIMDPTCSNLDTETLSVLLDYLNIK